MADSLKRVTWAKNLQNQDKVNYYLFEKARDVMAEETPDATELAFAKKIYASIHNAFACAMVVASNTTIGAAIDAGTDVSETDIQYAVVTSQWSNMASAAAD